MENKEDMVEDKKTELENASVVGADNSTETKKPASFSIRKRTVAIIALIAVLVGGIAYVIYAKRGWFVAATVNGSSISRLAVIQDLEKQAGKQALDALITKKLIADEMKKLGVTVKADDIDAEVKKAEEQVTAQGGTLEEALAQQSMTMSDLREQIIIRKELEEALADKLVVSDTDVDQYIKDNKMAPAKGVVSETVKNQVREQLQNQKFNAAAQSFISDLKEKASIVRYGAY